MNFGYIYLIGSSRFRWYKIGKSRTPHVRIKELGILLPFRIEVFGVWKAENRNDAERSLHEKFSAQRINGEWFELSEDQIKTLTSMLKPLQVSGFDGFSNIERDTVVLRKNKHGRVAKNWTDEEREYFKAWSQAHREYKHRKLLDNSRMIIVPISTVTQ